MHGLTGETGLHAGEDTGLVTRAAWLYHAGGFTQSEVADKLGVTSAKAHRLIGRATRAGLVRVFIDGPIGNCIAYETRLSERFGLRTCRVVPSLDEAGLPLRALGMAAANLLREALEQTGHRVVGVGHGRTLATVVQNLPRVPVAGLHLVSLLGGLPRRNPAHPFEVIDRLAEKTGAEAHLLPVPMFARAAADRDVLRRQTGVAEALALAAHASLLIMGVGEADSDAFLTQAGALSRDDVLGVRAAGAAAEVLGYFFDDKGQGIDTDLHARVTGLSLADISAAPETPDAPPREIVAVAGGPGKAPAINAVLHSHLLTGLITDELTARQLIEPLS